MKYSSQCIKLYLILLTATSGSCWQYFTALSEYTLSNSPPETEHIHSEYFFGDCRNRPDLRFAAHIHLDHMQVLGKIIVRGWLNILRVPLCIILRGTAYSYDLFRSTAFNFQICVPRITYCHTHTRFKYFFYEWYIPMDMVGGMNWDIYFYAPPKLFWQ